MANDVKITAASAQSTLDHFCDLFDVGGAGTLELRVSGSSPPATADTAQNGSEVATCTLNNPAMDASTDETTYAEADMDVSPAVQDATCTGGTPDYFRIKNNGGTCVLQGTVGTASCDLNLNTATIGAGAQLDITSFSVRLPLE